MSFTHSKIPSVVSRSCPLLDVLKLHCLSVFKTMATSMLLSGTKKLSCLFYHGVSFNESK